MPASTDFNVSPYWDTFNVDNDFYRVLFRPGFAVQARELTTLQTILQNQIEQFGNHIFKEGAIVIPGSVAYDDRYFAVKLQSTFGSPTPVAISTYLEQYAAGTHNTIVYEEGAILTGAISGVTAQVTKVEAGTTGGDPDTIWCKYISTNTTDNTTQTFTDGENISADRPISSYAASIASATLQATSATATGSAASVTAGIFFIRGFMLRNTAESITLDKYTNTPSYRIGFTVTETLVTPEMDTSLLDNAQGSSNYAAKGAHRLQYTLTLMKKALTATDDTDFIELARVENGNIVHRKKVTEYAVIADMLARRTYDESGNYIVRHFDIEARENLNDGTNRGIFTAAQGGVDTKETLVIAPGKAYINGYEVERQTAAYHNFDKARTTLQQQNDTVPFNLGNYAKVDFVYSQPDISFITAALDPFDFVKLYDQQIATGGTANGSVIGVARSRAFEYKSGTVGGPIAQYHHYLFDITMFTKLTMTGNVTLTANAFIEAYIGPLGTIKTGASGYVFENVTGAEVMLMQTEGSFAATDVLKSSVNGDTKTGVVGSNAIDIIPYTFSRDVKSIYQDASPIDYTANVILDQSVTLSGEITTTAAGTAITGTNTKFSEELDVDDLIQLPTGTGGITETFRVSAITDNLNITIAQTGASSNPTNTTVAVSSAKATRIRAKIAEEEETILVYKTPKDNTKTLLQSGVSDTSYTFRKQFTGTTNAGSQVTFTANAGETFDSTSAGRDYTLTVTATGSGSLGNGAILDLSSTKAASTIISATGLQTLEITDATLLGTTAAVTLMATITVGTKSQKTKTANKMQSKPIASRSWQHPTGASGTDSDIYGERIDDKSISLDYTDVYKIHAVYESTAIGTTPLTPTLTLTNATGTFTVGEVITGSSSGATGRVILHSPTTKVNYVVLTGTFTTNDTISGASSGYTASVTATVLGGRNVTANYLLDTGQRDSYYDISRLSQKPEAVQPVGQLLVIFDYFSPGTGDYFDVDSYTGQITYDDIPQYLATKVDPESKAPIGRYELRDALDFRPGIQSQTAPTSSPFSFNNKNFFDPGSSAGNMVVPDDNVTITYDFYLPRLDLLYLDRQGNFLTVTGIAAEDPMYPAIENINMLIARIAVGPYTYTPETDITINYEYNKRYTMHDIGKLEARVGRLEYATSLGLLERQTDSFQVLDSEGLDRFKSGFLVDNFYGHNFGNTLLDDYSCAVDPGMGYLRPKSVQRLVELEEEATTDTGRAAAFYQKTGDVITLAYTHVAEVTQPYASRAESVNPFNVTLWAGDLQLTPNSDIWMDTTRVPSITIDVEGNYEQMLREQGGNTDLGTVWDSWNTTWTGNERTTTSGRWNAVIGGAGSPWRQTMTTTTTVVDARQRRTGTNTRLVERIDNVSTGDRVLNIEVVPWIRERNVNFTANNMKPNTRVYAFFDRVDINADVKPVAGSTQNTTLGAAVTKIATTITVGSTTGFPSTGTLGIGDTLVSDPFGQTFRQQEQMTYTGLTATTFTGITRNTGNQFTEPQEWASGQAVTNQTYGTRMVTDGIGTLYGRFKIPNTETKRFRTGHRTFRLTDSSTNSMVVGIVDTSAETAYMAVGHVQTKREEILNVRNAEIVNTSTVDTRSVVQTVSQQATAVTGVWYDPLAQTIMCDQQLGMFITKIDVFFQSKDDTLPVWVEVRSVLNGYPSNVLMPFGKVTKLPADINIDATTGATSTTFVFDSPIYVQKDQEFCIVLASNSANYKVWISRLGEKEIGGTRTISTQPTLGSLFKSQNASTWEPSQFEDLKFTLYRADYTTANTGALVLVNKELVADEDLIIPARLGGGKEAGIPTLPLDPIETLSGTAAVKVRFKDHAMNSTINNVTITGVTGEVSPSTLTNAITNVQTGTISVGDSTNWPGTPTTGGYVKIDNEIIYYDNKPTTTSIRIPASGGRAYDSTTATSHEAGSIIELYMIGCDATSGIPLTEVNKTHIALFNVPELDSFQVATTTAANTSLRSGGEGVQCTKNISMDVMQPIIQSMELPNTSLTGKIQTTTGTSINGTQTSFQKATQLTALDVPLDEDHYFDAPRIVCSQINETNELGGAKSLRLTVNMTTTDSTISPIIDLDRAGIICISNKTNKIQTVSDIGNMSNYASSTASSGDNNKGIYITKKVALTQGATAIQVLFDAVVMSESNIKVLYKTLRTDSAEAFDDIEWVYFNPGTSTLTAGGPDSAVPFSKNRGDYKEYKYFVGKDALGIGTELPEYIALAIKIVLQSTNSSLPPTIKDFRAIAFQA